MRGSGGEIVEEQAIFKKRISNEVQVERRKESNRRKQVRKKRRAREESQGEREKERKRWMGRSRGSEKSSKSRIEQNRIVYSSLSQIIYNNDIVTMIIMC